MLNRNIETIILLITSGLILISCNDWKPDFNHAHPNAQKLMTDEFLWSPIEESSPFGNDDGSDAIYKFYDWRKSNKTQSPIKFIESLLKEWNYNIYNYSQIDTIEIQKFIDSKNIGNRLYFGIDDIIIATGFGQFIIEGKIDNDLKALTLTALKRQLLPFSIKFVDLDYRTKRIENIKRMIEIINAA